MPRTYGEKFLQGLADGNPGSTGVRLGRLCVDLNLPAAYVAAALGVSKMTVYGWFRGRGVSEKKSRTVEAFIALVEEDTRNGVLPAKNLKDAKSYVEAMIGIPI